VTKTFRFVASTFSNCAALIGSLGLGYHRDGLRSTVDPDLRAFGVAVAVIWIARCDGDVGQLRQPTR
jgi:hypothetical protein